MEKTIQERAHSAEKKWLLSDDVTRYGYEQGYIKGATEQQKIDTERACEWVFQNIGDYIEYVNGVASFHNAKFKDAFKQAMEEQQ